MWRRVRSPSPDLTSHPSRHPPHGRSIRSDMGVRRRTSSPSIDLMPKVSTLMQKRGKTYLSFTLHPSYFSFTLVDGPRDRAITDWITLRVSD